MSWRDIALAAGITDFKGPKKDERFNDLLNSFYGHSDVYRAQLQSVIDDPRFAGIRDPGPGYASGPARPADASTPTAGPAAPSRPTSASAPHTAGGAQRRPEGEYGKTYINEIDQPNNAPKPSFKSAVDAAIDRVRTAGTGFDPNDRERIANFVTYHEAVVAELVKDGFQARYDGEELAISQPGTNHSEQYDISTATNKVRRFYSAWISPSLFKD